MKALKMRLLESTERSLTIGYFFAHDILAVQQLLLSALVHTFYPLTSRDFLFFARRLLNVAIQKALADAYVYQRGLPALSYVFTDYLAVKTILE